MRKFKFTLIFFMVFLGIIITPNFVNATDDLDFEFQKEILYDNSSFEYNNSFNLAPTSYYSQNYNGTYSFENQVGLTNTDIDFVNTSIGLTTIEVIDNIDGHNEVLELYDNSGANRINFNHNFTNYQSFGSIEYWLRMNDVSLESGINFYDTIGINAFIIGVDDDNLRYYDGSWHNLQIVFDNIWYHIRIDFECRASSYEGLAPDTFHVYVNGIKYSDLDFRNTVDNLVSLNFLTQNIDSEYYTYYDAIGYSWEFNPFSFDYTSQSAEMADICFDGTFFWLIDFNSQVFKYDINGIYQSITYDWSAQSVDSFGICFDGTFFWMVSDSDEILYKYNLAGIYQAETWAPSGLAGSQPLTVDFDGTFFWILVDVGKIAKYDSAQNNLFVIDVSSIIGVVGYGICSDGTNVWITTTNSGLWKFDLNGNYLDVNIDTTEILSTRFTGCLALNSHLWLIGVIDIPLIYKVLIKDVYYEIGDNLIPFIETNTSLLQVSAYELTFKDIDQIHNVGESNPENWIFDESGGGTVQIDYDWTSAVVYPTTTFFRDRTVSFTAKNTDFCFMNRSSIDIVAEQFITITFGINITAMLPDAGDWFHIEFYESDDSSIITHLRFNRNFGLGIGLSYWDGGINLITNQLQFDTYYDFSVLLNFELGINVIDIWENGIYFGQFIIPFSDTFLGTKTLGDIFLKMNSDTSGFDNIAYIDYIGIFNNGTTQVEKDDSYGYVEIKLNNEWNFKYHNLLFFRGTGNLQIYDFQPVNNLDYVPAHAISHTLDSFRQHNNTITTNNLYDVNQVVSDYNQLIIYTTQNISFNYISIEGVALNQSTNQYWLELEHSNVDINESYFYVSSNTLYFNHISDDSNLEYIQATFDVNDVSSDNYSVAFKSYIQNNAYGYFRVNYTDTSNIIQLKNSATTTRFLLEQNRVIRNIVVLITDKDNDVITGLTTGYVYDIKLLDIINIEVSLITQTLINMMIPLIIILIPTLGFSSRFGKQVIIPFFILFSLILTATGTIPYWLFFVIAFSSLVMILFKSKDLGE